MEDISTAPGIAFHKLLRIAEPAALRELVGSVVVDTLEALDSARVSNEKLGELVGEILDPASTLRDRALRQKVVGMLPLAKAQELANKLGISTDRELIDAVADSKTLPKLLSFFGVVEEERGLEATSADVVDVKAGYALFDHQRQVAEEVLDKLSSEPRKVVLHMPTGSGKTRTAMHIICELLRRSEPTVVCWLAQNVELLDQAASEFEKAWSFLGNRNLKLTRFWGQRTPDILGVRDGLIVGGLAKMVALNNGDPATLLKLADRVTLTVIDEAHQAVAPTYADLLNALSTKRPRNQLLGLTATPGRTWSDMAEDRKLSDYFEGSKATLKIEGHKNPVHALEEEGYLAKVHFKTLNSHAGSELSDEDMKELSSAIEVPEYILIKLGEDVSRNLKIIHATEDLLSRHKRVVVFAPSVQNARMLKTILVHRGNESHVVTGGTPGAEREAIVRRFKGQADTPMVVVNYGVLTTGFDAPKISAAVIARPTLSLVLYSQMVGRATRGIKAGGNAQAEIITVVDPHLPGFESIAGAFTNWEDIWNE